MTSIHSYQFKHFQALDFWMTRGKASRVLTLGKLMVLSISSDKNHTGNLDISIWLMQMGCYSSSPFTCAFGQPVAKPIKRRQFKHQPLQCKNLPRCKFAKLPSVRFYMMTGGVIHIRWNDPFRIKSPMCHRK